VKVQARMAIDEVNDLLHAELPEGDWDTIGGLMFHLLGHVPYEGETTTCDGHLLTAEKVQGRRIGVVRVERIGEPGHDHDDTTRARTRGRNHDAGDRHDTEAAQ